MKRQSRSIYILLTVLIAFNLIFNWQLVREIIKSPQEIFSSDGAITEYIVETAYQEIKTGHNPFSRTYQVLYPFGVNYSLNDPGLGVLPYYGILRLFLAVHQAMIGVLLINLTLTGLFMWILLKELKISDAVAGLAALVFTFTPFVTIRLIGQYTYISTFVFPLCALMLFKALNDETSRKYAWAAGLGASLAWTLYLNFYYFVMVALSCGVVILWKWQWRNLKYLIILSLVMMIILSPWLLGVVKFLEFENRGNVKGFGGAVYYSAELKYFLMPNAYNPVYKNIFAGLVKWKPDLARLNDVFLRKWERMVYPGLIVYLAFAYWFFRRKKFPKISRRKIDVWMWGSLFFALMTMGPFLKSRGSIELFSLEGISIVLPLPFLLLHYIPGLESLRVPGRFTPEMVFLGIVGAAYILEYALRKTKYRNREKLLIILLIIFVVDQWYQMPLNISQPLPTHLYAQIEKDKGVSTVLEIPFTVRDGFRYLGSVQAVGPMQGSLLDNKPIMGGYFARLSDETFDYYQRLKLGGYLLSITDRGNYDPFYDTPAAPKLYTYPYTKDETNRELDFFGIKYILIKQDEAYTQTVEQIMNMIDAKRIMSAEGYSLYQRIVANPKTEIIKYDDSGTDYLNVGAGTVASEHYRAMVAKDTKLLFLGYEGKAKLTLELESDKPRAIVWYVNEVKGGEIVVQDHKDYVLPESSLKTGVNILFLRIKNVDKGEALDINSGVKIYSLKTEPL